MRPTIRFEVDAKIDKRLRAMEDALTPKVRKEIMRRRAEPIAQDMKSRVDVRSGQLRDSIDVTDKLSPGAAAQHVQVAEVEIYTGAGPLVQAIQEEYGNVRQAPDPFVRPAFDAGGQRAAKGIAQDGIDVLMRAAKS